MTTSMKQASAKNSSCWKRRSTLGRGLTVTAIFAIFLCVVLAFGIAVIASNSGSRKALDCAGAEPLRNHEQKIDLHGVSEPSECKNICFTEECIHTASKILRNMDHSVDPCDNFYKYACGGFIKSTRIPDDKVSINIFSIINDKVKEQLRTIIEAEIKPNEGKATRLVKDFYKSCMNESSIEEKGLKPLHAILRKFGGWPVLDGPSWNESNFDWIRSIYAFHEVGYPIDCFIRFDVNVDVKNTTKRIIFLDEALLELSREYLVNGFSDKIVSAYYSYMVDIATILGADKARAEEELKESLLFEMKLANISLPAEERRNITGLYNPMTVKELMKSYASIPWKEYFRRLLPSPIIVEEDEIVIVNVPSYLMNLEILMSGTSKRVQANYAMWRVVALVASSLNKAIRQRQHEYTVATVGRNKRQPRWKECLKEAYETLSIGVSSMYVKKYFNVDAKKNAVKMVTDIKEQFRELLKTVDWMDEETKKKALEKAKSMSHYIAYPDELLDDNKTGEFYSDLEICEDNYLDNHINVSRFTINYFLSKLRERVNKTDWVMHSRAPEVNAIYSDTENGLQLPTGILQDTLFNNDRPNYTNYGAIGYIIGHEITHGFDDLGRQYDENGNLVDWWAQSTAEKYLERAQCIIDQYSNFTVKEVGLNLNGINTQGENIADNGGVKLAYLAYKRWVANNGEEKKLPGLDRTPEQLFWISVANTWCAVSKPKSLEKRIITGNHSPAEYRILGTLSNMPEFASDFMCPLDSKMNPKKKCSVW